MIENETNEYGDQIASMVEGFVQMWIKFEAQLHDDLAKTHNQFENDAVMNETQTVTNFGLFYRVSSIIYPIEKMTMGELSSALSIPFSTATRITNWLVDNGYIQRLHDPQDRRVVLVSLTDKGIKLHKTIEEYTGLHVRQILSKLTPEEKTILFALIRKVVFALKEVTG
jgi:DNA-binding MarR family transcriptional regulator